MVDVVKRMRSTGESVREGLALLAPVWCAVCGVAGRAVCPACLVAIRASIRPSLHPLLPNEGGEGAVPVASTTEYDGEVRALIAALKEKGRVDAVKPLAALLAPALHLVLGHAPGAGGARSANDVNAPDSGRRPRVVLVPVPSRPEAVRQRGMRHLDLIISGACGVRPRAGLLTHARRVSDQAALTRRGREENLRGAFHASTWLAGRRVVIIDDVTTTGASLREAARAVEDAGGHPIGAAVIARTPLRQDRSSGHVP